MTKFSLITAVAFTCSLMSTGAVLAAGEYGKTGQKEQMQTEAGQMGMGQQAQTGQQKIRTASDLENFNVQTPDGEQLGKVDQVVVDLEQGKIGYVIVAAAEGQDKYIIPWKALRSEPQQQNLILNVSADMLNEAPKGDLQQALDRQQGRQIHQFYGVSPYWEESGMQQRMQQHMQDQQLERELQPDRGQKTRPGMGM